VALQALRTESLAQKATECPIRTKTLTIYDGADLLARNIDRGIGTTNLLDRRVSTGLLLGSAHVDNAGYRRAFLIRVTRSRIFIGF
jgi:hypothetical protein